MFDILNNDSHDPRRRTDLEALEYESRALQLNYPARLWLQGCQFYIIHYDRAVVTPR